MKRLLIFLFSLFLVSGAFAQQLKLLGGASLSRYALSPESIYYSPWDSPGYGWDYKSSFNQGFLFGTGVEFPLFKNIALEIDALYFRKGSGLTLSVNDIPFVKKNYILNVVSLPLLVKFKFLPHSSPYILHGGEISYVLSHKYKQGEEEPIEGEYIDIKDETRSFDFGAVVGGGFEIEVRRASFFVEVRYHFGLVNILSEADGVQSMKTKAEVVIFGLKYKL